MSRLASRVAWSIVILVGGAGAAGAQGASTGVPSAQRSASVNPHGPLPVECSACHAPDAWKPVRLTGAFKHAPGTFPLDGAHARTSCTSCHKRLDFLATPTSCASCHEDVHRGELGADCGRCHSTRRFAEEPAMKQAHNLTRFPLRGAHASAPCSSCHLPSSSGRLRFVGRSASCLACHAADARAVVAPDHQSAGFVRECSACHSMVTWSNARFDHAQTAFPLVGAHLQATCDACHADRVYRGKPTTCVSCHQADYDQTANPNHASAAFPATCETCHTTTTWRGAMVDHDGRYFPIYSGKHRGKWPSCATCHVSPTNYQAFSCLTCHEHNQTKMDDTHRGRTGYRYDSQSCYACHPRGGG